VPCGAVFSDGSIEMRTLEDHFLIAMPAMGDPNFDHTVTYLCKHDAEGALGIVINRPGDMLIGEVFRQLGLAIVDERQAQKTVLSGGPVQPDRGFVLHLSDSDYDSTLAAASGLKVTVSQDILADMAGGNGPEPVLVALGYAGWSPGQLEAELAANAWLCAPADPAIVFDTPLEQRWTAAVGLLGVDVGQLSNYAGHA
jgi:putative transcriptional regulator